MNILIEPALDGLACERLRTFAVQLGDRQMTDNVIRELVESEAAWCRQSRLLNGQTSAYEAAARLLGDLKRLKWTVRADACGIELESPRATLARGKSVAEIRSAKDQVRKELAPSLAQQFADPLVRHFIRDLEEPPRYSKRRSIKALMADGFEVHARVMGVKNGKAFDPADRDAPIKPYLQLVPGEGEPAAHDEFTGIQLADIWRYFRFTWSIPQVPIPGRQMFYLVRDAAHPNHAVIGIAALSNSPLMSPLRDREIGWVPDAFVARFVAAATAGRRDVLKSLVKYLGDLIDSALDEINATGLATPAEIASPTEELIARLQRRANEFASRREDALRALTEAAAAGVPLAAQETESPDYRMPPVSLAVLELEGKKAHKDSHETLARKLLVAKKRAFELARLCRARMTLEKLRDSLLDPVACETVLKKDEFLNALATALTAVKSDRVGTNILEITTCGAVPPYTHLLGGKLVALLLLSPEVADDYRRRYSERPAIISSQLKNVERTKESTVAWLNTTSLYAVGSSQYERLRLPAGVIAPDQPEIRFKHLGDTEGYGTVQFSEETIQALQAAIEERHQFKGVNSIFGEGFSPKFRKLVDGMAVLGFNASVLMRHDQKRRVYAVPMWDAADAFLRGEPADRPSYVRQPNRFRTATSRIADFWRRRWLASRLEYQPALEALHADVPRLLSDRVAHLPVNERSLKSRPRKHQDDSVTKTPSHASIRAVNETEGLPFWRDLAKAGPESCADELSEEQLARLHVPQPLDDFLVNRARDGFSIVLTGNAGDGKTHLLRKLAPALRDLGADVVTDATAQMRPNDVSQLLDRWKKAQRSNRPFCIAANEYPLHLLREAGQGFGPVDEVERQSRHRLAYGQGERPDEEARHKVIAVDLSLRNPLSPGFCEPLLDTLLRQGDVQTAAEQNPEGDIAWNLRALSNPTVRKRLILLFRMLAASGHRSTVRELWIWATRMLLGSGQEDRKPARSPERRFSSRLFERDDRFLLSALMRRLIDPAAHTHPRWDQSLEAGAVRDGWLVDGPPPLLRMDQANFVALKRRFYFEHEKGEEIFTLEGAPGANLVRTLSRGGQPDDTFKSFLIESINQAYCAVPFAEMKSKLYLWIGHRFHEQPSHGHVANQGISQSDLELLCPRLPSRLKGAFDYQPDHLLLEYRKGGAVVAALRVDYSLFVALERVGNGLPRQLMPDRELNRLDHFLEQLRRSGAGHSRDFFVHNHDERSTAKITLSPDLASYENIQTQ